MGCYLAPRCLRRWSLNGAWSWPGTQPRPERGAHAGADTADFKEALAAAGFVVLTRATRI
jgi:hypothetical protein